MKLNKPMRRVLFNSVADFGGLRWLGGLARLGLSHPTEFHSVCTSSGF